MPNVSEIYSAIKDDDMDAVRSLLKQGVDINSKDSEGFTPLMYSVMRGSRPFRDVKIEEPLIDVSQTVETLINLGANPQDIDKSGLSSLGISLQEGQFNAIRVLLQNGAFNPDNEDYHELLRLIAGFYDYEIRHMPEARSSMLKNLNDATNWLIAYGASIMQSNTSLNYIIDHQCKSTLMGCTQNPIIMLTSLANVLFECEKVIKSEANLEFTLAYEVSESLKLHNLFIMIQKAKDNPAELNKVLDLDYLYLPIEEPTLAQALQYEGFDEVPRLPIDTVGNFVREEMQNAQNLKSMFILLLEVERMHNSLLKLEKLDTNINSLLSELSDLDTLSLIQYVKAVLAEKKGKYLIKWSTQNDAPSQTDSSLKIPNDVISNIAEFLPHKIFGIVAASGKNALSQICVGIMNNALGNDIPETSTAHSDIESFNDSELQDITGKLAEQL
ncbi:hypothetical protein phytr_9080 [Candidatus Phycorickettsia trachydisci]|uniref:Uncharacterized protein n=1 Tax=Candidatus Phycorickettsia trachydisci TaxID=2115978 RepID=A0A2P1P9A5_9RICK|nr:ankyrin repeat domain-containing protein [Candidatus Phycorickettsia trachydisci]AVP87837.1 hypothetical protein phytr_9080 [Candidatus Phycorickettsia trachydisci]